jgi:peptidoglycan/LPS O-acetylase OafA/YrhL
LLALTMLLCLMFKRKTHITSFLTVLACYILIYSLWPQATNSLLESSVTMFQAATSWTLHYLFIYYLIFLLILLTLKLISGRSV